MLTGVRSAQHPDPIELAWAAGFFDGEGSTIARRDRARPDYRQLQVTVPQSGGDRPPEALLRFQRAVLGMGAIGTRSDDGVYQWRSNGFVEGRATLSLLWRHLGSIKRRQAAVALLAVRSQYRNGRVRRLRPRARSRVPSVQDRRFGGQRDRLAEQRAWAAGFLDAEGCFGLARANVRSDGVTWYRIRASASQHGQTGKPPLALTKLQRILGNIGRIERHGDPDDFKWVVQGIPAILAVLDLVRPHLGAVKREQARAAIAAYSAQPRLRGDRTHCKRGHPYDRRTIRNGRPHAVCNACLRLMERKKRASRGIAPRQFRDVKRRYTE